jgi:hypothetical protein
VVTIMSNKQQPIDVTTAERTLTELEQRRDRLIERRQQIERQRGEVAYRAHTGDAGASKLLDGVISEAIKNDEHLKALADAIAEGQRRLAQAREHEARAADRAKAAELRGLLQKFVEYGSGVDAALDVLVESTNGLEQTLVAIHRAGSGFPSDAQLQSLGGRVLLAGLSKTPFRRNFETVPPLERNRTMSAIVQQWSDTVERSIQQRLGDQTIEAAE